MANITLKGNLIHTNGKLPKKGDAAPNFVLVDKDLKDCKLSDYSGKKVLLSIVPSLDTAVCSTSAKKFNEALKGRENVVGLVVSADLPFAQGRFCKSEEISGVHTLSMMRSKDFAKDYGVLIQDGPLAGICARAVLVLDPHHKVLYSYLVPEITQEPNYEEAIQHLD